MGPNPCPYKKKEGQQMGINLCPYTSKDNKWAITHVHTQRGTTNGNQPMSTKLILSRICSHKTVGKDGTRLTKPIGTGLTQTQKECSHNMVDNKWESTHVY
jgi:hypothetical protein